MTKKFLIVGGDMRQKYINEYLSKEYDTTLLGFGTNADATIKADYVILPILTKSDELNIPCPFAEKDISLYSLVPKIKTGAVIFGGKINEKLKSFCIDNKFFAVDYLEREELTVANAVPTVEGAIQIAIENMPITIFNSKVLIIGFGRIGKVLTKSLVGLGAKVSVSTSSFEKQNWISIFGATPIETAKIKDNLSEYDLIINTAPHLILDSENLNEVNDSALIIDLASKPGGVDFESAKQKSKKTIWALSLPGKTAPKTSGEIIAKTILNIINSEV